MRLPPIALLPSIARELKERSMKPNDADDGVVGVAQDQAALGAEARWRADAMSIRIPIDGAGNDFLAVGA